ncbi:MAG: hypothetical protein RL607_1228 [Bacteroidota bacterium]|jgi:hypothetical protein
MKLKFTPFLLFFSLLYTLSWGQAPKKVYHTKFTTDKIVIDGKLDEATWQQAEVATDFVMVAPGNGIPEDSNRKSIIKITYTHEAIYVGALLMDDQPQTIARELTTRDDFATADHFGVILNGFNDGQQDFRFFVSAAGVQQDCVYTDSNGEDFSWNAIWDSEVRIVENGWIAEMRIPYAALRFPPTAKQTWGLNFYREVNKTRFKYTWNLIDNKINTESNQAGILEGIENIKTPTRLFFIPYSSFYLNGNSYTKTSGELKGGMDVKYGINDAFTLDAILIPDFGQTKFDNVVLNLGPFEQTFNENRPFFTEGTEMFSKGELFYSRRIGGSPSLYENLGPDEEVVDRPNNVNLFNALKISGRTSKGLGIGVLNAVTRPMYSEIRNTVTGATRKELVEPLANYNIVVLDQRFRKNSSVSFINTSVIRNSGNRDANVSALVFDLNTKKNTYKLSGDYKYSIISQADTKNSTGYNTSLNFAETSGKYRYSFGGQYVSTFFDNNDLGVNFTTHYHSVYVNGSYRILNQTPKLNSFNIYSNNYAEFDNRTGRIQGLNHGINVNIVDKKNDYYGFGFNGRPFHVYDFYEPRTFNESRFLRLPKTVSAYFYFSSNYARKFAIDINPSFTQSDEKNRFTYGFQFAPRYRFSNKLAFVLDYTYNHLNNNVGYVGQDDGINAIYMGRRKINTHTLSLSGKYSINHNMTFNLVTRYYWSNAIYNNYYSLMDDGGLLNVTDSVALDADRNFNTWNCDLNFSWWFAPGSQMNILYRNKAFLQQYQNFSEQLSDNLGKVLSAQNLDHIFSISIRYFIDYNSLKKN